MSIHQIWHWVLKVAAALRKSQKLCSTNKVFHPLLFLSLWGRSTRSTMWAGLSILEWTGALRVSWTQAENRRYSSTLDTSQLGMPTVPLQLDWHPETITTMYVIKQLQRTLKESYLRKGFEFRPKTHIKIPQYVFPHKSKGMIFSFFRSTFLFL